MGVIRFRLPANDLNQRLSDCRAAYFTGLDRTPGQLKAEFRNGLMSCHRESNESGRLFVPWRIDGYGTPIVGTATLSERTAPYNLAVELARGKLNEVRNQLADWRQLGLSVSDELREILGRAQRAFIRAATGRHQPEAVFSAAQESLEAAFAAGNLLIDSYTSQVLHNRLASLPKLPTNLGCVLDVDPGSLPAANQWGSAFNFCQVAIPWNVLAPSEGRYRWDLVDAQLAWCRQQKLPVEAGPLVDFRARALPDWIWLWEGDFETINGLVSDFVRQAVQRYKGKVPIWHVVHRPASHEILGLTEEEQIRIAARAIQIARHADPSAQFTMGVDRPWSEWMGSSPFQLGPLHLADYLNRADIGLGGIAVEIAPGYSDPGSHLRDLFEFSKLLDLYSLLSLPLHIWLVFPSSTAVDPLADPLVRVESKQWPSPPDEALQASWASKWLALAVAKPFVRSVSWLQADDGFPHLYPNGGLFRADHTEKPVLNCFRTLRREIIA